MSNASEQAREGEESDDVRRQVDDKGKEQVESAAKAHEGGSHPDQVAQENQVPDPHVHPNEDK